MEEIAKVSPLYKDLTYSEIEKGNCLWPYNGEPLRGEIEEVPVITETERDYKADFYLFIERPLFHSGTISRMSPALRKICPEPTLKIGSEYAEKARLKDEDMVDISTALGSLSVSVSIDTSINDNRVFLSNNFKDRGVFSLLNYSVDPVTNAPGIEGCEVVIKKDKS
jgi:formate dehydrogenase major subunit/formate dehydrogenase alpha subunit